MNFILILVAGQGVEAVKGEVFGWVLRKECVCVIEVRKGVWKTNGNE
jgi:hypothetical protein